MTTKKKKTAKQRRILIVALIVAAAIIAGSTFAWFSSKDEVTNRLTASANYNVSIVEDFQPPADWLPGQTINKDVAAVNTGNVDAFVRMWLDGHLRLLNEDTSEPLAKGAYATVFSGKTLAAVTDVNKKKLGLNFYSQAQTGDEITYYKTLSTDKIDNDKDINHASTPNEESNVPAMFSEVQSMQSAGVLVYAPDGAKYTWTLEQAADLWVLENGKATLKTLAKDTAVGSVNSSATTKITASQSDTTGNYYGAIDASTFQPQTTGLYLFRRNVEPTNDGTANTYEYSGYYYVADTDTTAPAAVKGKYFALHTEDSNNNHSDYVVPASAVTENNSAVPTLDQVLPVDPAGVKLFTASESVVTDALTWVYDSSTAGSEKFTVTYAGAKNIVIEIALANIGLSPESWTAIDDGNHNKNVTFYYNNDLEAGDTTVKLVDSVKLSENTELGAYLAFDFDLDVFLDSIQVTMTNGSSEDATAVANGWAAADIDSSDTSAYTHTIHAAKGNATVTDGEITSIAWAYNV